jgi:putative transposase
MGLARSTFYDEPEIQPIGEARLVEQIKAICAEWPAYGCRRVTAELDGGAGFRGTYSLPSR